jgi:hypothetical protein
VLARAAVVGSRSITLVLGSAGGTVVGAAPRAGGAAAVGKAVDLSIGLVPAGRAVRAGAGAGRHSTAVAGVGADLALLGLGSSAGIVVGVVGEDVSVDRLCDICQQSWGDRRGDKPV